MSQTHRVEDAVFEEIHELSYEVWTLPREDAPAQPAITDIQSIAEAFELMEHYGGSALFYVRDSRGRGVTSAARQPDSEAKNRCDAQETQKERVEEIRRWWRKSLKIYLWIAAAIGGASVVDGITQVLMDGVFEGGIRYFFSILLLIPVWRALEGGRK